MNRLGTRAQQIAYLPLIQTVVRYAIASTEATPFIPTTGRVDVLGGVIRYEIRCDGVIFRTEGERARIAARIIEEAALVGRRHVGGGLFAV